MLSIRQKPDIVTAVTGVATNWTFQRTSAVGTGGSAQTAWLADTTQTALDADITCRSKPTGGATVGTQLEAYTIHSEETNAGTIAIASAGGRELVGAQRAHGLAHRRAVQLGTGQRRPACWLLRRIERRPDYGRLIGTDAGQALLAECARRAAAARSAERKAAKA